MAMLVKYEKTIVNVAGVAAAHWERDKLFVHYIGGRFQQFSGDQAIRIWQAIEGRARDLLSTSDLGAGPGEVDE